MLTMETTSKALGMLGEELAFSFLSQQGYKILLKNYKTPLGEIDLIARHKESLVFIEVKTRSSEERGSPAEGVRFRKRKQIVKVAHCYLKRYRLYHIPCRFDVVSILLGASGVPQIDLIADAFGEE